MQRQQCLVISNGRNKLNEVIKKYIFNYFYIYMNLSMLTAISPIDGRYRNQTTELAEFCSEYALIRYRVMIEVEYFIALCKIPLSPLIGIDNALISICKLYEDFTEEDALRVKEIERTTNHDVKAVEYFLKEKFSSIGIEKYAEFIHFGLTSQDVTTSAVILGVKNSLQRVILSQLDNILQKLNCCSDEWKGISMLAHTHGQPASPTRLGKEIRVFTERLLGQRSMLLAIHFSTKFGGATGNFNAHYAAYPDIDWSAFADNFIENTLHLNRTPVTTQIEPYDNLAALFDGIKRINTILIDLCRDMWLYISMGYFAQKIAKNEVGSSAMPHKVNPIDFENAEGNLGVANALLEHFASKLPISRLQRDLTDSTVLRNVGTALAHSLIAYKSLLKGMNKVIINRDKIDEDLDNNWAVVAEGIQTILRREGYPNPYETLKNLTRTNEHITKQTINSFIDTLQVSTYVKEKLKALSPQNYTGR
jgi:adenylosuccinate lyase